MEQYYSGKFAKYGPTASGVDWKDSASQQTRFVELLRILEGQTIFSIIDYGCGYGALVDLLEHRQHRYSYQGFDVSEVMIEHARTAHGDGSHRFLADEAELNPADFVVASGIFNVRLGTGVESWRGYILETLDRLNVLANLGFAFNMLTSYSDPDRMRNDLFYGDPLFFFDHCKRHYGRNVALLHDYGLWEFTLLVRKELR